MCKTVLVSCLTRCPFWRLYIFQFKKTNTATLPRHCVHHLILTLLVQILFIWNYSLTRIFPKPNDKIKLARIFGTFRRQFLTLNKLDAGKWVTTLRYEVFSRNLAWRRQLEWNLKYIHLNNKSTLPAIFDPEAPEDVTWILVIFFYRLWVRLIKSTFIKIILVVGFKCWFDVDHFVSLH